METRIKDLTIEEFRALISETVRGVVEETVEDMMALSSPNYIMSVAEARKEYKEGKAKSLEDVFDE